MCCSIKLTLLHKTIRFDKVVETCKFCRLFDIPPSFFHALLSRILILRLTFTANDQHIQRRDRCVDLILPNLLIRTLSHTKIQHSPLFEFLRKNFPYSYLKMNFLLLISLPLLWVWYLSQPTFSCNLHKMSTLEG